MEPEYVQVALRTRGVPSWTHPRYTYETAGLPEVLVGSATALVDVAEVLVTIGLEDNCTVLTASGDETGRLDVVDADEAEDKVVVLTAGTSAAPDVALEETPVVLEASGVLSLGRDVSDAVDEEEIELGYDSIVLADSVDVADSVEDGRSVTGVGVRIRVIVDWLDSTTGVSSVDQTANLKGPPQEIDLLPM